MRKIIIFIWLVCIAWPFGAVASDGMVQPLGNDTNITWLKGNFPPYNISEEPFKNQGMADYMLARVIESLPGNRHKVLDANSKRIFLMLKNKDHIGYPTALKTEERAKSVLFSLPYIITIPNAVITTPGNKILLKRFTDDRGQFLIAKALANDKIFVGLSAGRAYGGSIDQALVEIPNKTNILFAYNDLFGSALRMLLKGSVHYTIGYPVEAVYHLEKSKSQSQLVIIPVKGMPEYILGSFAFPKTAWGRAMVAHTNQILRRHRNSIGFHKVYERWLDKEGIRRYRGLVERFYKDE